MYGIIQGALRVAWSDFRYLQYNFFPILISIIVTPLLYLLAFGYGLGRGITMEGVDYIAYVIPGIIALSTVTSCFMLTAHKIQVQRIFYASFDEVMLCPISYSSIILGKTSIGLFKGGICCFILTVMGSLLSSDFHVTWYLILTMFVSCLVFSLLGVLAAFVTNSIATMNMFNSLVIIPMTFLCGTLFSIDALPDFAKYIIEFLPLTQTSECMRAAALCTEFPWLNLIYLALFGVAFYLISWYWMKKGKV